MKNSKKGGIETVSQKIKHLRLITIYLLFALLLFACDKKDQATNPKRPRLSSPTAKVVAEVKNKKLIVTDSSPNKTVTTSTCDCPCSIKIGEVIYSCE